MKKIGAFLLALTMPLAAQADPAHDIADDEAANAYIKPEREQPLLHGLQFGAGIPLVLPLAGYTGFIGYAKKDAESFFGKRFGARFDFQIPSALKATGTLVDGGAEYNVNAGADVLFLHQNFDKITTLPKSDAKFEFNDINYSLNLEGANGAFALKNQNIGGVIDFYPFGNTWFLGGIRLSGGYYSGKMNMSVTANLPNDLLDPEFSYSIASGTGGGAGMNGKVLANIKNGSKISANLDWKYSGPYAGIGFDLGVYGGFKFYFDAGVVFAKPPKVSKSNLTLPTMQFCYQGSDNLCNKIDISLNEKPDVNSLIPDVLNSVIKDQVNTAVYQVLAGGPAGAIPEEALNAMKDHLGVDDISDLKNAANFGDMAVDILNYLQSPPKSAPDAVWMRELFNNVSGYEGSQMIVDALNDVKNNFQEISGNSTDSLQSQIDDAWNSYQNGIDDLNDSLKDMKFMPVVKLGVMYRF
ncbi:MAG: hypothetical protein LBB08_01040 [Rickettsiales bacterium]|jgi:hypothetical protein|nr:hypothetical protein [Rickettsiales bacterium]